MINYLIKTYNYCPGFAQKSYDLAEQHKDNY